MKIPKTISTMFKSILCFCFYVSLAASAIGDIVINEIHYAPKDKTIREEFLEIYNSGDSPVDLSGWYFSKAIDYTFPQGASIFPQQYLVIAQDPATISDIYGIINAIGPFAGRLDNDGEEIILRDSNGTLIDRVDYKCGFPWPTIDKSTGLSMELINPAFDNELGGHWRISNPGIQESNNLIQKQETCLYLKGTGEASAPVSGWREIGFTTGAEWKTGRTSIGYGENFISTTLDDMRGNYTSIFIRKTFEVEDVATVKNLVLQVQYDDGFNAWINGQHMAGANVSSDELLYNDTANSAIENHDFVDFPLPRPVSSYLVQGTNVLAIQVFNASISGSSDSFIDFSLTSSTGSGSGPTPGAQNSVYSPDCPPSMRQLTCIPKQPTSNEPVLITIKATDSTGVANVELEYQAVDPGSYIEINDPEYLTNWTAIQMNDAGENGDQIANDDIFSVEMPAAIQQNRRLVRYRIKATDSVGLHVTVPYADDPQPNFAYFVYDGIPSWSGAINPASSDPVMKKVVEYPPEIMASVPCYFLITKKSSCEDATWFSKYKGSDYLWTGTMVYDGVVYDHIHYRARGGVWRYAMGKNMWKFDFLRGHYFQARNPYGKKYDTKWDKLNFSALIQQGNYLHRGEQGLFEGLGFTLFNMAGVESPKVNYLTFRIVDEGDEFGADQYGGDFWGLYMVLEQMDGRFLDEHHLPDGNLYKMEGGSGDLNNLGVTGVTDKSDLNSFMNTYNNNPAESWWTDNLNLTKYYSYRSIVECIHHYDIGYGKNYFYYLNPETNIWSVFPWDLDLTWADNMYGNGNEPFKSRVLASYTSFNIQYQNRMREIKDLLYNTDQAYQLIDEFAAMVNDPAGGLSIVDADRSKWDYNPVMVDSSIINTSKAGYGRYYESGTTRSFEGMVQLVKNYVVSRGNWIDSQILTDSNYPDKPSITYSGLQGYPVDRLSFQSGNFSDPQGNNSFGAMKWRIGEVALPDAPPFDPENPRPFEIKPVWESGELTAFQSDLVLSPWIFKVGHRYRARVRMMDDTYRWSHWSDPIEFTVAEPTQPFPQQLNLRITEIMYNPEKGSDYEFIELHNTGDEAIDLTPVSFVNGIKFDFSESEVKELPQDGYVVLVKERKAFESAYNTDNILIGGEFSRNLENNGEPIELICGANSPILSFTYSNTWYPSTNGGGYSLTIVDPSGSTDNWNNPSGWKESFEKGGSPGRADEGTSAGGRQRIGDYNQDTTLDISDAISMLLYLFGSSSKPDLPCEGDTASEGGNLTLLDLNADGNMDLSDIIYFLSYLFDKGAPPVKGTDCIRIEGCPNVCF